jgi:hypothetical protein
MIPEGSLHCLQKPATCHYREPGESNLQTPTMFQKNIFKYYTPIYS